VTRIGQHQHVLFIPKKKTCATSPNHLSLEAIRLILAQPNTTQPNTTTPSGQRDLALLLTLMYDTGARVQEMADLTVGDFRADPPATVKITTR
jgi:site-specific recombinase XerD